MHQHIFDKIKDGDLKLTKSHYSANNKNQCQGDPFHHNTDTDNI